MLLRVIPLRGASVVGALGAVGACTVVTDVDRLTRGLPARADAAVVDAGLDGAGAGDALDDGPPVEASRPFCEGSNAAFCADFDGIDPFVGVTEQHPEPFGELLPSTIRAVSSPRSLRASLPRREAVGQEPAVYLSRLLPGAWRRIVFTADVFFEGPAWQPGDSNSAIVWLECWSATNYSAVYFFVSVDHTGVGRYPENATGPVLPADRWINVGVDFDPVASTVAARIGDATYGRALSTVTSGANPNCQARFGINSFNDPIPAFAIHFDNVTVEQP